MYQFSNGSSHVGLLKRVNVLLAVWTFQRTTDSVGTDVFVVAVRRRYDDMTSWPSVNRDVRCVGVRLRCSWMTMETKHEILDYTLSGIYSLIIICK